MAVGRPVVVVQKVQLVSVNSPVVEERPRSVPSQREEGGRSVEFQERLDGQVPFDV